MLFIADQGVDDDVLRMLRRYKHKAERASALGLGEALDNDLAVAVDNRDAVLISHDREFGQSRKRYVWGRHIWLRCHEWDAAITLEERLTQIVAMLEHSDAVVIEVRPRSMTASWSSQND